MKHDYDEDSRLMNLESDDEYRWLVDMKRKGKLNKRGEENLKLARQMRGVDSAD